MVEFVQGLIEFFNCLLEVLIAVFFFNAFQKPRFGKGITAAIVLAVTVLFFVARIFQSDSVVITVLTTVLTIVLAASYRFKWYQMFFYAVIESALPAAIEVLVALIFETVDVTYKSVAGSIFMYVLGILLSKSITMIVILAIYKTRKRAFLHIKNSIFIQFMLLPASTILVTIVFYYFMSRYVEIPQWLLIVSVVAILLLMASNVLVFYLLDRQEELWSMEEQLRQVNLQLDAQKAYYDELYNSQQEIRRSRHDQKNLLIAILAELDHGNLPKLRQLIARRLDNLDRVLLTNPKDSVLESILYIKQQEAEKHGISIDSRIRLTRAPAIDELELAVMLSNLLDNAVESLVRDGAADPIRCQVLERNENLVLSVENRVYHPVNVDDLSTTKADKKYHGLGLPSVKKLVDEHDGLIEISCKADVFSVSIILSNVT